MLGKAVGKPGKAAALRAPFLGLGGTGWEGADAARQQEGVQAAGQARPGAQAAATSLRERTQEHGADTRMPVLRRAVLLLLPREVRAHTRCPGTRGRWAPHAAGTARLLCVIGAPSRSLSPRGANLSSLLSEHTEQSSAGRRGGRAVPACTQAPVSELLVARTATPPCQGPPLASAPATASAHQIEEATCIIPPSVFQLSSFGVDQN